MSNLETFTRWLSDGKTTIGVFENHDLGHHANGQRCAFPFDTAEFESAVIGKTKAPDGRLIGLGWRYVLVGKFQDAAAADNAMADQTKVTQ